jgi:23S rRNA pseudouridine2605 synthase
MQERLAKVLAAAGVASRRDAEQLIRAGKVTVNGQTVKEPGTRVDPESDHIAVDDRAIARDVPRVYVVLNKPRGYVTTREDPHAEHTVMDLIRPPLEARMGRGHPAVEGLHPIGRLDTQTEGLLLLTNDGSLTNALTHPKHQVAKVYQARVRGIPDYEALERLRTGVPLFGRRTLPARVQVVRADRSRGMCVVEVELKEGRNQQVRRMLQAVGYPVDDLRRVSIGPVHLERLKPGQWRFLSEGEVEQLRNAAERGEEEAPPPPKTPRRPAGTGQPPARTYPPAPGRPGPGGRPPRPDRPRYEDRPSRGPRPPREGGPPREGRAPYGERPPRDGRPPFGSRPPREGQAPFGERPPREGRPPRETGYARDARDARDARPPRDDRAPRDARPRDAWSARDDRPPREGPRGRDPRSPRGFEGDARGGYGSGGSRPGPRPPEGPRGGEYGGRPPRPFEGRGDDRRANDRRSGGGGPGGAGPGGGRGPQGPREPRPPRDRGPRDRGR